MNTKSRLGQKRDITVLGIGQFFRVMHFFFNGRRFAFPAFATTTADLSGHFYYGSTEWTVSITPYEGKLHGLSEIRTQVLKFRSVTNHPIGHRKVKYTSILFNKQKKELRKSILLSFFN